MKKSDNVSSLKEGVAVCFRYYRDKFSISVNKTTK
jgi:hypothetical protein